MSESVIQKIKQDECLLKVILAINLYIKKRALDS